MHRLHNTDDMIITKCVSIQYNLLGNYLGQCILQVSTHPWSLQTLHTPD